MSVGGCGRFLSAVALRMEGMGWRGFYRHLLLGAGEQYRCGRALGTLCTIETETEKGRIKS